VVALAACGAGGLPPTEYPAAAEQLVTSADIDAYPRDSPARALLSWWRGAQYADSEAFLGGFSRRQRRTLARRPDLPRDVEYFAGAIRTSKPLITEVQVEGARATVFTKIRFHTPVGATRFLTTSRPQAFRLVNEERGWRLGDSFFVMSVLGSEDTGSP
jgi:hypothetical protein